MGCLCTSKDIVTVSNTTQLITAGSSTNDTIFCNKCSRNSDCYNYGSCIIGGNECNRLLVSNVNYFSLNVEDGRTIVAKIGSQSSTEFTCVKAVTIDGPVVSVWVTNNSDEPIKVSYVSAIF